MEVETMCFAEAFEHLKNGEKIKRVAWGGYWEYCKVHGDIIMHCKGGQVIPLTQTKSVLFTVENMTMIDWVVAD